jgi:hypothetical protein
LLVAANVGAWLVIRRIDAKESWTQVRKADGRPLPRTNAAVILIQKLLILVCANALPLFMLAHTL